MDIFLHMRTLTESGHQDPDPMMPVQQEEARAVSAPFPNDLCPYVLRR